MKKTIYIILTLSLSILFYGCSDFMTEKTNGQVFENVLSTEEGLESALTGAYSGLNQPWSIGLCNGTFQQICAGGDDIYCPTSDANGTQFDRCNVTDSNGSFGSTWNGLYQIIIGANTVINNYENCDGSAETIKSIAGEAYFLRAYAYFMLVRIWGEIPLILSSSYDEAETSMSAATEAEVYERIERDIDNAVAMLGATRRNNEIARPNNAVARALRAEIYLTEAGWPLKKDGYYEKAATEAKAALADAKAQGIVLEDKFADLFINKEEENCLTTEDLFVVPASQTNAIIFYGAWSEPSEVGGWDIIFAEVGFMNRFPEGIRKELTFFTEHNGVSWENWKQKHPSILKLMKYPQGGQNSVANCNSVLPAHLFRLSQTALTYAEAQARYSTPDDEAYYWLNEIRKRAGLEELSGLSKEEFIQACVDERAWELAGEGVRWFDLLRLELVEDSFTHKDPTYDPSNLHPAGNTRYTFPLPASETLLNPNLKK